VKNLLFVLQFLEILLSCGTVSKVCLAACMASVCGCLTMINVRSLCDFSEIWEKAYYKHVCISMCVLVMLSPLHGCVLL